MSSSGAHVGVQRGDGLVARFGAAAVVLATGDADAEPFAPALLTLLDGWSDDASPSDLAWAVAVLVAGHHATAPAFGAAIRVADSYLLLLHGAVRAQVRTPEVDLELSGASALTWIDRLVADPVARISITVATEREVTAAARSDLRGGMVNGDGFVLTSGPADATGTPATGPAVAPVTGPQPTAAVLADDIEAPVAGPAVVVPAAVGPAPVAATPVAPAAVAGQGGYAPWSFAANPQPTAEETAVVKSVARTLVADDGTRILLDRDYVFGRDPLHDQSVVRGAASPIVVRDPDQLISRVQVFVAVINGVLTVRDGRSANGTFIAAPGAAEWDRLDDRPVSLPLGWSMRIGRRVHTYAESDPA
ncbi:hypothetical protein ABIB25_004230 [Nakamurella sp. UYEF19]